MMFQLDCRMKKKAVLKYLPRYNSVKTVRPPDEGVGTRRGVSALAAGEAGPFPPPASSSPLLPCPHTSPSPTKETVPRDIG